MCTQAKGQMNMIDKPLLLFTSMQFRITLVYWCMYVNSIPSEANGLLWRVEFEATTWYGQCDTWMMFGSNPL